MKFAAALLALAVGVMAASNDTVTYTTEVVTAITTYCPEATEVTYGGSTYTITEATTLTISDCPCTIKRPVTTVSSVICHTCPTTKAYHNSTVPTAAASTKTPVGTVNLPSPTPANPTKPIETAGAGRAAVLSGGALAGLLGFAAFVL